MKTSHVAHESGICDLFKLGPPGPTARRLWPREQTMHGPHDSYDHQVIPLLANKPGPIQPPRIDPLATSLVFPFVSTTTAERMKIGKGGS